MKPYPRLLAASLRTALRDTPVVCLLGPPRLREGHAHAHAGAAACARDLRRSRQVGLHPDRSRQKIIRGGGTGELTGEVTDPVTDPVDQILALLGTETLAPSVMQERLGLKHRPTFRANYLHPALDLGLIEMTIPSKPSSRLQAYRITADGRKRLASRPVARKTT